jgi:hypothetical protein
MDTHADEFPASPQVEIATDHVELTPVVAAIEPTVPLPPCHVMLDLETWGTGNKAVIVSIGACKFDRDNILDAFHVGVDPTSCQTLGLEIDAGTVLWWMDPQQREALDAWLQLERIDLASALVGFDLWCKSSPGRRDLGQRLDVRQRHPAQCVRRGRARISGQVLGRPVLPHEEEREPRRADDPRGAAPQGARRRDQPG